MVLAWHCEGLYMILNCPPQKRFMFCEFHFNSKTGKDIERPFPPAPRLLGATQAATSIFPPCPGPSIAKGWESFWVIPSTSQEQSGKQPPGGGRWARPPSPRLLAFRDFVNLFSKFTTRQGTPRKPKRDNSAPAFESPTGWLRHLGLGAVPR